MPLIARKGKVIYKKRKTVFLKVIPILLMALLWVGFISVRNTRSYYSDKEQFIGNSFIAGAVDFTLSNGNFLDKEAALNFQPGTTTDKTIGMALEPESNPIIYEASTTNVSGDLPFCRALNLDAKFAGTDQFSGNLIDFISDATTTIGDWQYSFSLPDKSTLYNKVCSFDFEYNGRQTAPHHEYKDGGYYDIETASSTLYSWGFRINKVYYDVATDRGSDLDNEWVEIYNQTDANLDITGWQICDDNSCNVIPASTTPYIIPAKGFGIVIASSTTLKYWELKDNIIPILLDDMKIGDGLGNDGDRLILKRPDGVVMDEMNWGTDTGIWNPAAVDVPNGHALGRKPNGYDTNSPSDFVDLGMPEINLINPDWSGTLTWYWTYHYPITWTATNPNGLDSDIKISLYYIKDIDQTNTITPDDPVIKIADSLPNSSNYDWQVPSGFIGYIWIKIVATGPENVMLNSSMISGKIYDPFPEDMWNNQRKMIINSLRKAGLIADDYIPASLAEVENIVARASGHEVSEADSSANASTTSSFSSSTSSNIVVDDIATSTDEMQASTTESLFNNSENVEIDNSTTTPEIIIDGTATSTSDMISSENSASTSSEPITEPIPVPDSVPIGEPVIKPDLDPETVPVLESTIPQN
jgi:hypothetical protein